MRIRRFRAVFPAIVVLLIASSASFAQLRISVSFGPPALPVYEQPLCPGEGYIWTPGYWAWGEDDDDYYWVPGTWVLAPEPGFLWTPPYWGWADSGFVFYDGYWGPQVGFYGGINYGFGYFGEGFEGGRWENGRFFYNRAVTNINVTNIHNVYNTTVINNRVNRVSYNGGNGGVQARPTPQQEAAAHQRHLPPVAVQREHLQAARSDSQLRASANHGRPPIAATEKPGAFHGREVMPAREAGGPYNPPANRGARQPSSAAGGRPTTAVHPKELPSFERHAPLNTGNPKFDRRYEQQQSKLQQKQDQEREKLQQKQDKEHQQLAKRNADEARKQQTEQRHQQQTQQLQEKHVQQQQRLQERQRPESRPEQPRPHK